MSRFKKPRFINHHPAYDTQYESYETERKQPEIKRGIFRFEGIWKRDKNPKE